MFAKEVEKSGVFIVRKMREQPRARPAIWLILLTWLHGASV
jgi:hypothetical protein